MQSENNNLQSQNYRLKTRIEEIKSEKYEDAPMTKKNGSKTVFEDLKFPEKKLENEEKVKNEDKKENEEPNTKKDETKLAPEVLKKKSVSISSAVETIDEDGNKRTNEEVNCGEAKKVKKVKTKKYNEVFYAQEEEKKWEQECKQQ